MTNALTITIQKMLLEGFSIETITNVLGVSVFEINMAIATSDFDQGLLTIRQLIDLDF